MFSVNIRGNSLKEKLSWQLGPTILKLCQRQIERKIHFTIPFAYDVLCLEERFSSVASLKTFLKLIGLNGICIREHLVVGCSCGGNDIRFWLHRGSSKMIGLNLSPMNKKWQDAALSIKERFHSDFYFLQGSAESLPFCDHSFDLVTSDAVFEHIRDVSAAVNEMARVVRPYGWCWHSLGPLYNCYGGDHCIAAYGRAHGYDHLLLNKYEYEQKVNNQAFFNTTSDPRQHGWARSGWFSFLTAQQYLSEFSKQFDIRHLLVKISEDGLKFREQYGMRPESWTVGCERV